MPDESVLSPTYVTIPTFKALVWLSGGVARGNEKTIRIGHPDGAAETGRSRSHGRRAGAWVRADLDPDGAVGCRRHRRSRGKPGISGVCGNACAELRDRRDLDRRSLHVDGRQLISAGGRIERPAKRAASREQKKRSS